jgi:spore coat polysaccharide biosynthesis protein SpsF
VIAAVTVVQARYGSTRLPGKALLPIGGVQSLRLVLARLLRADRLGRVVLATTMSPEDDPLVDLAAEVGVAVHRGEEMDVLGRVLGALRPDEDPVVRVCADRPFVAPEELDRLVELFLRERPDYCYNHMPEGTGYPYGLGAEAVRRSVLEALDRETWEPRHREHVTLALWDRPERYRLLACEAPEWLRAPGVKLDLDDEVDLARLRAVAEHLEASPVEATAREVLRAHRASEGLGEASA